jgi:perosamine synthetase
MSNYYQKLLDEISNPFGKYSNNEAKYVLEYLNSENEENDINPWTARFEEEFAKRIGVKYAIAHNSGTSTLHSCLHAAGVGAGDEVIGPVQTGIWFPFVCLHQNAIPIYVDVDQETFNMDPNKIEEKITDKTKAIIATHMHGSPSGLNKIIEIAEKHQLYVIEDCAQSALAEIDGRIVGSIGDMASFSFETKKHMTTGGQGGMVVTNNEGLAERIRKHSGLGFVTLTAKQGMTSLMPHEFQNPHFKRHDSLAYNYRMPEVCAAIGLAQLEDLDNKINKRIKIARMYDNVFKGVDWFTPQKIESNIKSTYWSYVVKYDGDKKHGISWENFYKRFNENGGDSFYGCLALNTDETVMRKKTFYGTYIPKNCNIYTEKFDVSSKDYLVASKVQPRLMQFKTGYRDLNKFQISIDALYKTIKQIENND